MSSAKLIKLNIYVFLFYFLAYFLDKIYPESFSYFKVALGIVVFFVAGLDIALVFEKISKVSLDFWEFLTLGIFASLFFMPVIIFVFYGIRGFISEISVISLYVATSFILLVTSRILEKNESRKN